MSRKNRAQADSNPSKLPAPAPSAPTGRRGRSKRSGEKVPARAAPRTRVEEEGEEFDLDGELAKEGFESEESADDQENTPPAPAPARAPANPRPARGGVQDPFVDPSRTQSTKSASTADVQFFFERTGERSICKPCK